MKSYPEKPDFTDPSRIMYWKLEKRKDWPVICCSVDCPICRADVGDVCHPYGRPDLLRSDFHQERKRNAAKAYLEAGGEY